MAGSMAPRWPPGGPAGHTPAPSWPRTSGGGGRAEAPPRPPERAGRDHPGRFVAEHQRMGQLGVTDGAFAEPVQVRAAQTDRGDLAQGLARPRVGYRLVPDPDVTYPVQPRCLHAAQATRAAAPALVAAPGCPGPASAPVASASAQAAGAAGPVPASAAPATARASAPAGAVAARAPASARAAVGAG